MLPRFARLQPRPARPNLHFWLALLTLNTLLFLPLYLLNLESEPLPSVSSIFNNGLWLAVNRLLIWRETLDPFRLSLELVSLIALWILLRPLQRPPIRYGLAALYLLALCYYTYEALMLSIYHADPVFYSHYFLARDGLPFLARNLSASPWFYVAAGVGLALIFWLLWGLVNTLLTSAAHQALTLSTRVTVTLLAALALLTGLLYQTYTAKPEMVVSSLVFKLHKNIADSRQLYQDVVSFDDTTVRRTYNYTSYDLRKKPDIYLIFIESYGSVLYKQPAFRSPYLALLREVEATLDRVGWQSVSALSESPTWGGGSWMAYTSLLFGLRIDNHPQYLSLLNKYQVATYPDLGRYFQTQGYYYAWVSPISRELDDLAWAKYLRFFGVDQWVRYRDLNYSGPEYGWGPAPPDQYVLNFAQTLLRQQTAQPLLFVTLTQNSHFPWAPQPQLVADWRTLTGRPIEKIAAADANEAHALRQDYLLAIDYQLHMLADFIVRNGDANSLFLLIGDHQPPRVSRKADGFATPMHIISQDPALLATFGDYGFTPGLRMKTFEVALRHEGFYSLLMRILQRYGGAERIALPPYLPNGVVAQPTAHSGSEEP